MSFGDSLTKIRKEKGISRKDLAEQLDIPYTTLRNYETDQREPGHKLLIKIANLLSVSVDELVGYPGKKKPPRFTQAKRSSWRKTMIFWIHTGKRLCAWSQMKKKTAAFPI